MTAPYPSAKNHWPHSCRVRLAGAIAALTALVGVLLMPTGPAHGAEYPTWAEVEAARQSETDARTLVAQITTQIAALQAEATSAAETAMARGNDYEEADAAFLAAAYEADRLDNEAARAEKTASQSQDRAARIIASQARTGGQDLTGTLLIGSQDPELLLSQLGFADKLAETTQGVYTQARQDQNVARSLGDQATVARDAREDLRDTADAALRQAEDASTAAAAALSAQNAQQAELQTQLAVLTEQRSATEADFEVGEAARVAERARVEAAAAARAAAAATSAGQVDGSGWANPTTGQVVSAYGYRIHPIQRVWKLHSGIDIAGGCEVPIYAASAGTIAYSGVYGSYGNWILIEHAGGVQTGYAHIANGGLLVSAGQRVEAGQLIARAGSTGGSTGCHLHYEVRPAGGSTDPAPFMAARGIELG